MAAERTVDLRSDTVTRPSAEMRRAIAEAEVGDDVYDDDPTVHRLQARLAALLGKEAALFFPSGTQANQSAILLLTRPGTEAVCEANAHLFHYELAAAAAWSGVQLRPVPTDDGVLTADHVRPALRPNDPYLPSTSLICAENTHNTVMVSLSKGLGAPIGSALAGTAAAIEQARTLRKRLGGGMRQVGLLAAAGLYALDHNLERLEEDHARARRLAEFVMGLDGFHSDRPDTNIVMIEIESDAADAGAASAFLRERGVLIQRWGPRRLRAVTHLDVDDAGIDRACEALQALARSGAR
jgi:threonine aldolase